MRNPETGFTRTVKADADGYYRFPFLPVGKYQVDATRDGAVLAKLADVTVALGAATTANVTLGAITLEEIQVLGTRIVTAVDVKSTESATNVTREDLERLPVERDMLVGRAAGAGPDQGRRGLCTGGNCGVSFGGSSIAENTVYINGLNVTDFYNRVGFSSAPYSFYKEFQVKTGGYSVEFGRTTGGVINAVTRSGTNEFEFGTEVTWEPSSLQSSKRQPLRPRWQHPHHRQLRRVRSHDRVGVRVGPDRPGQAVLLRDVRGARLPARQHRRRGQQLLRCARRTTVSGARRSTGRSTIATCSSCSAFSDENEEVTRQLRLHVPAGRRAAPSATRASPTAAV